jgi:hypothetical protein
MSTRARDASRKPRGRKIARGSTNDAAMTARKSQINMAKKARILSKKPRIPELLEWYVISSEVRKA